MSWDTAGVFTVVFGMDKNFAIVVDPGLDLDEISHEGGNTALEEGRISPDHVLGHDFGLVKLIHHWDTRERWACISTGLITVVGGRHVGARVAADPRLHPHKVGHERGDGALEHRRVAADHVLGHHLRLVVLGHHCRDNGLVSLLRVWANENSSRKSWIFREANRRLLFRNKLDAIVY